MSRLAQLRATLAALEDRRGEIYGINRRNVELVYAHNERRHYPLADDKLLCKQAMVAHGVPVPGTIFACRRLDEIPHALLAVADRGSFVLKPAHGSGGDGIVLIGERLDAGRWRGSGGREYSSEDLHHHLASIVFGAFAHDISDQAIIEERVIVDPRVLSLYDGGVADVRVILREGEPFISMMRVPTERSLGRANLHQGAVGVAIDLDSGITTRARLAGRDARVHPDSGKDLVGFQVPRWRDVVDVARRAAAALPLGYLGVDLLMDIERGPLVVEVNVRPGLEIQNVHGMGLGRALERTT